MRLTTANNCRSRSVQKHILLQRRMLRLGHKFYLFMLHWLHGRELHNSTSRWTLLSVSSCNDCMMKLRICQLTSGHIIFLYSLHTINVSTGFPLMLKPTANDIVSITLTPGSEQKCQLKVPQRESPSRLLICSFSFVSIKCRCVFISQLKDKSK